MKYFKWICSENLRENIKLNMCRNPVWHTCYIPRIKSLWGQLLKTKTTKLRKKSSTQLLRECWSFLTKLMTCQNLQNKLLNITVLFIWYLLASLKKNVTRWLALFHFGEYLFQSTRHFGECFPHYWFTRQVDLIQSIVPTHYVCNRYVSEIVLSFQISDGRRIDIKWYP